MLPYVKARISIYNLGKIIEIFLEIIKTRIIILSLLNIEYKHVSILSGFTKSFIVNDAYKTSAFIFVDAMILLGHHSLKDEITN